MSHSSRLLFAAAALLASSGMAFAQTAANAPASPAPNAPAQAASAETPAAPTGRGAGGGRGAQQGQATAAVALSAAGQAPAAVTLGARGGQAIAAGQGFAGFAPGAAIVGQQTQGARGGQPAAGARGGQQAAGRGAGGRAGTPLPPADSLATEFRSQVSAVMGPQGSEEVLLVTYNGWMRASKTLRVGEEWKEGWRIASANPNLVVLKKQGEPDKQIDLTRWAGSIPIATVTRAPTATGPAVIQLGSTGMVRPGGFGGRGQPAAAGRGQAQPAVAAAAAGRGAQPAARGGQAVQTVVTPQVQAINPGIAALLAGGGRGNVNFTFTAPPQ